MQLAGLFPCDQLASFHVISWPFVSCDLLTFFVCNCVTNYFIALVLKRDMNLRLCMVHFYIDGQCFMDRNILKVPLSLIFLLAIYG